MLKCCLERLPVSERASLPHYRSFLPLCKPDIQERAWGCVPRPWFQPQQGCTPAQVSLVLPSLQDNLGPGATYLLFAGVGLVAVATIYTIVPVCQRGCDKRARSI